MYMSIYIQPMNYINTYIVRTFCPTQLCVATVHVTALPAGGAGVDVRDSQSPILGAALNKQQPLAFRFRFSILLQVFETCI